MPRKKQKKPESIVFFQPRAVGKTKPVVALRNPGDSVDALSLVPEGRNDLDILAQIALNLEPEMSEYALATKLAEYCANGDLLAVKFLIEVLQIDAKTTILEGSDILGALSSACDEGQLDVINYLLASVGIDPNVMVNRYGGTLLHEIIVADDKPYYADVLRLLQPYIKLPKVINKRNHQGCTALYTACYWGKMALAKILIEEFEADVNIGWEKELAYTPFLAACYSGNLELTTYFIVSGRVNLKEGQYADRAFLLACGQGHLNIAQYIKTLVLKINFDEQFVGPLLAACKKRYWDIAEYLMTQPTIAIKLNEIQEAYLHIDLFGAPQTLKNIFLAIPAINEMKVTLQMKTVAPNRSETVLATKIARATNLDESIDSVRHKIEKQLIAEQIELRDAKETQQKKRDLNQATEKDRARKFADKAAIAEANQPKSSEDVMLKLIDAVRTTDLSKMIQAMRYFQQFNNLQSSASSASASASASSIKIININEPDAEGNTLLHIACKLSTLDKSIITINKSIIATLIKNGANLHSRNHLGETPFFVACKEGSTELMTYFLDTSRGYDYIATPNHAGQTPFFISKQNKKMDSVRLRLWLAQSKADAETLLRANLDTVDDLSVLEEPDVDQDKLSAQWLSVELSLNKKIALMGVTQLKDYFYISDLGARETKKMKKHELKLLENQAIKLLQHAEEDPAFDWNTFASIPNLLLKYEQQHALSLDFISLWDKATTAAMQKSIKNINLLARFISVFANSGMKPSEEFKAKWIENINAAAHIDYLVAHLPYAHAISSSIRSCAKLFTLVDPDMIIPEGLIRIVNDQACELSVKDIHSLGISNVAYELSGKPPFFHRLGLPALASETRSSEFQNDVFRIISNHPATASNNYQVISEKIIDKLLTPVDIFIDRGPGVKKLIIQADGPTHFNSLGHPNINTRFNTELLEKLGYEVIRISLNKWIEFKDDHCKDQYLDQLLSSIQSRDSQASSSAATSAFVPESDRIPKRTVKLKFMDHQSDACAASVPPTANDTRLDMAIVEASSSTSLMP